MLLIQFYALVYSCLEPLELKYEYYYFSYIFMGINFVRVKYMKNKVLFSENLI